MKTNKNTFRFGGVLSFAALVLAGSCTVHEPEQPDGNEAADANAPVVVGASESLAGVATRSGESPQVKDRTMLFTYPSRPSGEMKSAVCRFDAKGYGYVYPEDATDGEPLKWKDVYTEKPGGCDVYLDNLLDSPVQVPEPESGELRKQYDFFTQVEFGPYFTKKDEVGSGSGFTGKGEKVMVAEAGSPEAENGIDIIWGKIDRAEVGKSLHFVLTHKMSQLTFRFHSEDETIRKALEEGTRITVSLNNVQRSVTRWPGSPHPRANQLVPFNRRTGVIEHSGRSEQETVLFASEESLTPKEETTATYYASRTMVLPPFAWINTYSIPILAIELDDGSVYSGGLPTKIQYWMTDPKGESQLLTSDLSFKPGYHTVFDVKLVENSDKKEILFQDITVSNWEFKYNDEITASESGINTWEDLTALAEVFNEDASQKNYRLMKYGTWDGSRWVFKLWNDITVSGDVALPQFDNGNFEIDFNGKKITVGPKPQVITEENYRQLLVKQQ